MSSIQTVNQASSPLRSQVWPGHRNRFLATCWLMVLAPRSRLPRPASVIAFSICSKSKPTWTRNFWSSAAITATAAWGEIRAHGTHSWRCANGGDVPAAIRSPIMKAVTGTGSQRSAATARMLARAAVSRMFIAHRASRAGSERLMGRETSGGGGAPRRLDEHRLGRHIVVALAAAGLDLRDLVDHVDAAHHAAEHGVAEVAGAMIQEAVVHDIDEELRGRAVQVVRARHRERAALVLEPVVRLVLDRRVAGLVLHVGRESAALDHESGNHAVEDRAVVVALVHVTQEVLRRDRGRFLVHFDAEVAVRGLESNQGVFSGHGPILPAIAAACLPSRARGPRGPAGSRRRRVPRPRRGRARRRPGPRRARR